MIDGGGSGLRLKYLLVWENFWLIKAFVESPFYSLRSYETLTAALKHFERHIRVKGSPLLRLGYHFGDSILLVIENRLHTKSIYWEHIPLICKKGNDRALTKKHSHLIWSIVRVTLLACNLPICVDLCLNTELRETSLRTKRITNLNTYMTFICV